MKEGNTVLGTSEITHPRTKCHLPKYLNRQQHRCANLSYRNTNRVDSVTTYRAARCTQSMSVNCTSSCNKDMRVKRCEWAASDVLNWLVALRLPARWWQDATTLLPQRFRTANLPSRTCRLLHAAALLSLQHFHPLVRWCIYELPLRIPVQFMPLGLHKHLHIQALFYPTTVTSYFPSARSPYKLRHAMNVFVKCDAILRAEGKQF
jgi:hypothetical protein